MSMDPDYTAIFMAACTYIDEGWDHEPLRQQRDMEGAIALFPGPEKWSITNGGWGPASNESQLAFVALSQSAVNSYCVAIRGTVGTRDIIGFITEWWKNLEIWHQVGWPYFSGSDVKVARGFSEDFNELISATAGVAPASGEKFTSSVLANHDHWVYFNHIACLAGYPGHVNAGGAYADWPYPPPQGM